MNSKGLSLIEILIAMALSLVLMSTLLSVWVHIKETSRMTENMARLQETERLLTHIFTSNIRMAGYVGCGSLVTGLSVLNHTGDAELSISSQNAIYGYSGNQNSWRPTLPKALQRVVMPDSDVITVRYLNAAPLTALRSTIKSAKEITVGTTPSFKSGDKVLIANCIEAELFNVSKVQNLLNPSRQVLVSSVALKTQFNSGAVVGDFVRNTYFISTTDRVDAGRNPIDGLYVEDVNGKKREIITHVEMMKIVYGVAAKKSRLVTYRSAAFVNQSQLWSKVRSVKLAFLLKSPERISTQATHYNFQTHQETDPKGYLHKEWDITIALRNR